MAKSDDLQRKKDAYNRSLTQVKNTAYQLKSSIDKLASMIESQKSCYVIDDDTADDNYLVHLSETEEGIYKNIINNIIPGLNSKISSLSAQIKDAKQKEELEKDGA